MLAEAKHVSIRWASQPAHAPSDLALLEGTSGGNNFPMTANPVIPQVRVETIKIGDEWTREDLAKLWGYKGRQAIDSGIVMPKGDNKIALLITREKWRHSKQFEDVFDGNTLQMDGQPAHRSDYRLINAAEHGNEIHLFYRDAYYQKDHSSQPFTYRGKVILQSHKKNTGKPTTFFFKILGQPKEIQQSPTDLPKPPSRLKSVDMRIIRDTPLAHDLKSLYGFSCQVSGCNFRIEPAPNSFYIEVHHVRPLGGGHAGADGHENMMVLCPNHHAMFDYGIPRFISTQSIEIGGVAHNLLTLHSLAPDSVKYHNTAIHKLQYRTVKQPVKELLNHDP